MEFLEISVTSIRNRTKLIILGKNGGRGEKKTILNKSNERKNEREEGGKSLFCIQLSTPQFYSKFMQVRLTNQ
jgi:hypothetical protein